MTLDEILKAQGLDDDQIKSAIEEMKSNKIYTTSIENADIRYKKAKDELDELSKKPKHEPKESEPKVDEPKSNEDLENQKAENAKLLLQIEQMKKNNALKDVLRKANVKDEDYIAFKFNSKFKDFKIDDEGKIEGIDDKIKSLKTEFAEQFESSNPQSKVDEFKLKGNQQKAEPTTLAEAIKLQYENKTN